MEMLQQLKAVTLGLNRRFPDGNGPFMIMTRLLEEAGELAEQVNHFEATGVKREKLGEPSRAMMAKEVMDVMRCAWQIVSHYDLEAELGEQMAAAYERMLAEGLIEPDQVSNQ